MGLFHSFFFFWKGAILSSSLPFLSVIKRVCHFFRKLSCLFSCVRAFINLYTRSLVFLIGGNVALFGLLVASARFLLFHINIIRVILSRSCIRVPGLGFFGVSICSIFFASFQVAWAALHLKMAWSTVSVSLQFMHRSFGAIPQAASLSLVGRIFHCLRQSNSLTSSGILSLVNYAHLLFSDLFVSSFDRLSVANSSLKAFIEVFLRSTVSVS